MIKSLFLVSFCMASFTSYSQLYKSNWILGGAGSFSQKNNTLTAQSVNYDSKFTDLTLSPNVGYFVLDKFSIGLRGSFVWSKSKSYPPGSGISNQKEISIGPSVRYYLLNMEKQFNIITEGNFMYGQISSYKSKGPIVNYSLMTGPVIFFNTSIGMEFLFGYFKYNEKLDSNFKNDFSGLQMSIGFQYYLESKN